MIVPQWLMPLLEADREKFIPYAGHIRDNVIIHYNKTLHAMLKLHGMPFELAPNNVRNGRERRINTLLRSIADPDLEICIHLVRHRGAPPAPQPQPTSDFVRGLAEEYHRVMLSDLFVNEWYISVLLHEPMSQADKLKKLAHPAKRNATSLSASPDRIQALDDVVYRIETTLEEYAPQRLGIRELPTGFGDLKLPVTDIGTALYLIRTAHHKPIPHTCGSLTASIYTEPCVFKPKWFEPNIPGEDTIGAILGFLNYPATPTVGMFNVLLSTPYPLVMTHCFRYRSMGKAMKALKLIQNQMRAATDAAEALAEGLSEAMDETASLRTASGLHHFALAVYAPDRRELDTAVADAQKRLSLIGAAAPTRELNVWYNGAMECCYYRQLPGSRAFRARPGTISTLDLADMASLDNYPQGASSGYWGASPIRLKTNGGTAYDIVLHDEDVAHALLIGRMGSGKTALLGTVCAFLEPVMGPDGIRVIIDKDDSNRLLVEACGGIHQRIRRNRPSGLAPLVAFDDTPQTQGYLHSLYTWLMMRDGKGRLSNDADNRLARGIQRQLRMPPSRRSMGGIREMLGYDDDENGAGARFERYCRGGSMGWLLDNDEHVINFGPGLYAFDFTEILPQEGQADDGSCQAAASVITHQLGRLMDGRRIACFFDECKFYMEPLGKMIEDYSLTGRKKELMLWLFAQQPEHFTETPQGKSLVAQMRTKFIFPSADYDETSLRALQLSPAAIRMLKTDMTLGRGRRFLLWRANAPTICEFDLTGLRQLPLLAGRPGTIALMERIREEQRDNTTAIDEFYRRMDNIRRAA